MNILLERLDLQDYEDGLVGLLREAGVAARELLQEPYWLQDDSDGKCFGPAGFSECGDATLWHVRQQPPWKRGLVRRILMRDDEEEDWGFALELVDRQDDFSELTKSRDCLTTTRRKRGNNVIGLGRCASLETAWSWRVSGEGILFRGGKRLQPRLCLWRTNGTVPVLSSCEADEEDSAMRLVRFSMVRYHSSSKSAAVERVLQEDLQQKKRIEENEKRQSEHASTQQGHHVTSVDLAHSHASEPIASPDVKPSSQLLYSLVSPAFKERTDASMVPRNILKDASPILLAMGDRQRGNDKSINTMSTISTLDTTRSSTTTTPNRASTSLKLRKMPTHPYIASAKNNVWTDPQTGLEFQTDLCEYLGHDRKESGRHTLTGVGQYTRTVFNIKVYGVALYVSKRDVLADPLFEAFSTLSQEELRRRPDFFAHLRQMPSPLDGRGGLFDRTLLLKLNMQLSTDTMRSSLQGDWKMLTAESKDMLINSSLLPRPADDDMLATIQSDENPGKCSCGQVAPEEYGADPSCCSRGTELGFTWRKNGDLEIRLNGRIMDVFPRPDVAAGIFYDYLRDDDPISPDFLNAVVDGFPFLLAPLSQVKGVSSGNMASPPPEGGHEQHLFMRAAGGFVDIVSSRAEDVSGWLHDGANVMAKSMMNAAQTAGDTARNIGEEMDRQRKAIMRQAESSFNFVASRMHPNRRALAAMPSWMKGLGGKLTDDELRAEDKKQQKSAPRGRAFGSPLTRWLGESQEATLPDEIVPMIHPTMNLTRKVFLAMVHLYLMLLLIVSLPGSPNTRTKLVVRRKRRGRDRTDEREGDTRQIRLENDIRKEMNERIKPNGDDCQEGMIKKSLSYFL
jgi:hypothetical protein